jgi:hypothetical protein
MGIRWADKQPSSDPKIVSLQASCDPLPREQGTP